MNPRQTIKIKHPEKKKPINHDFMLFLKKIERDEILINKCEIPKDGGMAYVRPWKL